MKSPSVQICAFVPALCLLLLCTAHETLHAQGPSLLPAIGHTNIPDDSAAMCPIPMALDRNSGFKKAGLKEGTIIPDFTLFDVNDNPLNAGSILAKGKPLLLVHGSYTCPVFRGKIATINRVVRDFGDQLHVALIYTVEAHPLIDTSFYFGKVYLGEINEKEGILYRQPRTYAERKAIATDMLQALKIDAPVYLDDPCNNWWEVFGHAPNNAYLIDTDGMIFAKQTWFDRSPDNINTDIKALLAHSERKADTATGTFRFTVTSASVSFTLQQTQTITLDVFDSTGNHRSTLTSNKELLAGKHSIQLPPLETGTYTIRLTTESGKRSKVLRVEE